MLHELKIYENFADAIVCGDKTFEIRENDRGFQKGDRVKFMVLDRVYSASVYSHPLCEKVFEITYVINGWGLKNGFVVFGIREVADGNCD